MVRSGVWIDEADSVWGKAGGGMGHVAPKHRRWVTESVDSGEALEVKGLDLCKTREVDVLLLGGEARGHEVVSGVVEVGVVEEWRPEEDAVEGDGVGKITRDVGSRVNQESMTRLIDRCCLRRMRAWMWTVSKILGSGMDSAV